jgi:hypothetical protein
MPSRTDRQSARRVALVSALCLMLVVPARSWAADMTAKDVQIAAKAIGFLQPAPSGDVTVAIVYPAGDAAGKQAAEVIAGYFGSGLKAHGATLTPKVVDTTALGSGSGYVAVIVVDAASGDAAMRAAQAQHIPCITSDLAAVQAGHCTVGISTAGKIDIVVNRALAAAAGFSFGAAFLMLVREV